MSEGKRYYWLKLKDDFFESKRIKKLRNMAGGDTYTIIYLKMQLEAMKHDGVLKWTGLEDSAAEELALDLDEKPDDVAIVLTYLLHVGLAETEDNMNFFLPYAVENTGSEGSSTKRVREFRQRQTLHCNADETPMKQICNGEKEIEKDIEIDIEIDIEKEKESSIYPAGFESFWKVYPNKTGKQAALKAWNKLKPSNALTNKIINAVETQKTWEQWVKEGGRYIPNPATWLNQGRWDDEGREEVLPF